MIHPDKEKRKQELNRFKEHIRFARDFGCSIVGTETGNVYEKTGYTVDNYEEQPFLDVVESVSELVAEAEKFGVIVAIEGGINHPVHSPQVLKRLLDSVDFPIFKSFLIRQISESYELSQTRRSFSSSNGSFGDRMVIMHAKDFIIEDGWIKMVPVVQDY